MRAAASCLGDSVFSNLRFSIHTAPGDRYQKTALSIYPLIEESGLTVKLKPTRNVPTQQSRGRTSLRAARDGLDVSYSHLVTYCHKSQVIPATHILYSSLAKLSSSSIMFLWRHYGRNHT